MRHSGPFGPEEVGKWIKTAQDQEKVDRGSKVKDQEVDQDCANFCKLQNLRTNHYADAQVGDAEGLIKSLRIIILQPQVYLCVTTIYVKYIWFNLHHDCFSVSMQVLYHSTLFSLKR